MKKTFLIFLTLFVTLALTGCHHFHKSNSVQKEPINKNNYKHRR